MTTDTAIGTTPIQCSVCGAIDQIPTETLQFMRECIEPGEPIYHTCDVCEVGLQAERDQRRADKRQERANALISATIPLVYRTTDENRLHPGLRHLLHHQFPNGTGLLLRGPTDCQKSTIAYAILQRRIADGTFRSAEAICGSALTDLLEQSWSQDYREKVDATARLRRFEDADIVLLDDLDKLRVTPTSVEWLFNVFEARTSNRLPMLITTQRTGDALEAQLGSKGNTTHGPAIVRRMRDPRFFRKFRARNGDPRNPANELSKACIED